MISGSVKRRPWNNQTIHVHSMKHDKIQNSNGAHRLQWKYLKSVTLSIHLAFM